jgi:putative nucleotidyltransferase with HDIG domain
LRGQWQEAVERGEVQFRLDRRDAGGGFVLDVTANYLPGADTLVAYGRDITKRVAAEEALRAEQVNLAAIFESSPVAMVVFDDEVNVVRVNRAALCLIGAGGEALLEHRPASRAQCGDMLGCVHSFEDERGCGFSAECPLCPLRNAVRAALEGGTSLRGLELAVEVTRGGRPDTVWLRMGAEPMVMDGAPHVTVALDDITDRYRAQLALAESDERFRSLAEQVPGFVTIKDPDGRYLYLSSLWGAVDEGGEAVWMGKRPEEVWSGVEAAVSNAATERALAGDMIDDVTTMRRGDEVRYFHSLHFPIAREGAQPLVGGLMIDVTDQVQAQEEVRRQAEQLRRTVEGAVLAMSQVVETRDPYTAGHERRVAELATAVGRELGLGDAELDGLRLGSLIHDIGKIAVPAEILAKPGRLSTVEFNLIKQHAQSGYEILSVIDFGRPVADMVLQHHERLDGSGYPNGLTGEELLVETRILSVADVVEAMSSHRPYRAALGADAALAEIREGAGVRYDPDVVAACERVMVEQGFRFTP